MTDLLILAGATVPILTGCWLIHVWVRRSNWRHGWDAHKNGLPLNLGWGPQICDGYIMAMNGLPRP
jgi:hypothetical protein